MLAVLAVAAVTQCQARSVGPGSLRRGGTAGATCMLSAFRECRAAGYTLSSFGVDTVREESFRIVPRAGGCAVYVTDTNRVVPQQPRVLRRVVCTRLRKTPAGDVVADHCSPPTTVSLTKLS